MGLAPTPCWRNYHPDLATTSPAEPVRGHHRLHNIAASCALSGWWFGIAECVYSLMCGSAPLGSVGCKIQLGVQRSTYLSIPNVAGNCESASTHAMRAVAWRVVPRKPRAILIAQPHVRLAYPRVSIESYPLSCVCVCCRKGAEHIHSHRGCAIMADPRKHSVNT